MKDILNRSSDSENDIFVNTNSNVCNYAASASKGSIGKHHLLDKPDFLYYSSQMCVNNGSKLLSFHCFRPRFRIIPQNY
jgi:hypothetical protein